MKSCFKSGLKIISLGIEIVKNETRDLAGIEMEKIPLGIEKNETRDRAGIEIVKIKLGIGIENPSRVTTLIRPHC